MKQVKKIVSHPLFIILLFCAIIITGEHMAGFYLMYVALGLYVFAIHSVFGAIGVICLLISYYFKPRINSLINIVGSLCMTISLFVFFLQPNGNYNYVTFHQLVPLLTLITFGICMALFIFFNVVSLVQLFNNKNRHSTV